MSFTATVENDTIKLPPSVHLPDGTEVRIEPAPPAAPGGARAGTTLAERLAPFIGCLHSGIGDLADNHDHYLYGTQKQKPRRRFSPMPGSASRCWMRTITATRGRRPSPVNSTV